MILEIIVSGMLISGANYADYHTSKNGYANGYYDMNILVGNQGERLEVVKVLATSTEILIVRKLFRDGHKTKAWLVTGGIVATNLVIARHNMRVEK